jgi:protein-histidine pros-kinase
MKTIAARLILIFLIAGAFQTTCIWGAYALYGREQRARDYDFMAADVALAQQVMRSVAPEKREALLRSYDRGFYHFVLSTDATTWMAVSGAPQLDEVVGVIQRHLKPPDQARGVFQQSTSGGVAGVSVPVERDIDLVVSFDEHQPYSGPPDRLVIGYLVVIFLIAATAAAVAVRIATRPLRQLATAARQLAGNLDAAALREGGPSEVREATRAFNAMQVALKRNLDQRTHMLAAISHDLKTPLTRLALRAEEMPPSPARDRLARDVEAMSVLVSDGLEFAQSLQLREPRVFVDLTALIDAIAGEADDLGWRVTTSSPANASLRCAPRALHRALWNLVENACVHGGGEVVVQLAMTAASVEIRIADEGPGIPEEMLERVFEPYVRADLSRGAEGGPPGSGLGLPIARNIIQSHGGTVTLRRGSKRGSVAEVILPR